MSTLLICPASRNEVASLSERLPLANVPLLGQSLLEYWLSALALQRVSNVIVLANDRPELAAEVVHKGERWGLNATVINESRELTTADALLKYADQLDPIPTPASIAVLDHFPGKPADPLFATYEGWFSAVCEWMPSALTEDRVGINEIRPGVWMGCYSQVSPQAELHAPCWIGQHVFIGSGAVIGPLGIVEDGSFIEPGAELSDSWVGPDTFVGQFARITGSIAWGATLVHRPTGSAVQVSDPFLLCALRQPHRHRGPGWFSKLSELYLRNKNEAGLLWKHLLLHKEG